MAIVLVMLSHFAQRFATEAGRDGQLGWAVVVGMVASPTFILLSGAVYGTLSQSRNMDAGRLRNLLVDRGLFLLIVAHPLLGASNLLRGTAGAWHHLYITDTLAPALIFGPALARRTRPRTRVAIGFVLVLASWIVLSIPTPPVQTLGVILREAFVGTVEHGGESWWGYHWPLAQWFGVYLIGTAIGEKLAHTPARPWRKSRSYWLFRTGCLAALTGAALNIALIIARGELGNGVFAPIVSHLISIRSKFPPSPAYLLWFGGIGLVLMALMYAEIAARWHALLLQKAQTMGRSSLVLYITGDYLFHVPFVLWHPRGLDWWFPAFVAMLVPLYWIAKYWSGVNGNRFLTVGVQHRKAILHWYRLQEWRKIGSRVAHT